jgi:choline dehydrogenase-like flavoprotein
MPRGFAELLGDSGIGPADALRSASIDVVVNSPNVGVRMRENRVFLMQFRLTENLGDNELLSTETGREQAAAQYQATQSGSLAAPPSDLVGFFPRSAGRWRGICWQPLWWRPESRRCLRARRW